MKLRPYPEYKDSGVPWLGEMPRHWNVPRLKAHVSNVVEQTSVRNRGEPYIALEHVESWTGKINIPPYDEAFESQVKRFSSTDIIFGKLRPYLAKAARPSCSGVCSGEFLVLRPRGGDLSPIYLEWALRSKSIIDVISGSTYGAKMPRAEWSFIGNLKLSLPSAPEQTQIARFLDWKTAQIDRFIRNKRRLIELLKEQKQALINQAVTGAIDVRTGKPYPEYKDSGVPWLGKVPKDWNIRKFKYLACFSSGGTPSKSIDSYWDGELPWVSPKDMKGKEVRDAEDRISEQAVQDSATGIAKPGDLLIVVRSGILRRTIPVGIVKREVAFNQDIKAIAPKQDTISSDYLLFLINGCDHLLRDEWVKVGATVESIEHELMANTYLPVPTLEEQGSITDFCRRIEDSVCKTVTRTQREIDLIQEYRTRLISDVVTGKLDVRGVAVPDFEKQAEGVTAPNEPEIPACDHEAMA